MSVQISNKKYAILQTENSKNIRIEDFVIEENGSYAPEDQGFDGFGVIRVNTPNMEFEELNIIPTTTIQTFTSNGVRHGYSPVIVAAVNASIDSNIKAENIAKGIEILGVEGTLEFLTEDIIINPTTNIQTFTPTKDGFYNIKINAVTSSIDTNIKSNNIRSGVEILGVTGTIIEANNTTRDITVNGVYTVPAPYTGFSEVKVDVAVGHEALTINPSITTQTFTAEDQFHGFSPITVNPVTSSIDSNIKAKNIKKGVSILGVTGSCEEVNTTTIDITSNGTYTVESPYNGFSEVNVDVNTVNNTDITITANGTYIPESPYTGYGKVITQIDTVNNTTLTINPSTSSQNFVVSSPYTGFNNIIANPVTASIDSNIKAENIVKDITILGVTGTYAVPLQTKAFIVDQNTATSTIIYPDSGYDGISALTLDLSFIENALQELNAGDTETTLNLQNKTVSVAGTYTADNGYDGLGEVVVDLDWVEQAIEQAQQSGNNGDLDNLVSDTATNITTDADTICDYAFYHRSNLSKVTLNNAVQIGSYAFANSGLTELVIRTNSVCTLGSNALPNSINSIKVPSTLVASYKTTTNWVDYAAIITTI